MSKTKYKKQNKKGNKYYNKSCCRFVSLWKKRKTGHIIILYNSSV